MQNTFREENEKYLFIVVSRGILTVLNYNRVILTFSTIAKHGHKMEIYEEVTRFPRSHQKANSSFYLSHITLVVEPTHSLPP